MTDVMRKTHKVLSQQDADLVNSLKTCGENFIEALNIAGPAFPESGREFSIAKTKMEEAVMWAVKGVTK
ncbi:hypothetical protein [Aestuariivirga sp.]|uniref:Acb2/Tad1 domain-containing protein n=1 Tax=Aestuariivirga sp. TaxID=2650926 RepID=UPI0039E53AF7